MSSKQKAPGTGLPDVDSNWKKLLAINPGVYPSNGKKAKLNTTIAAKADPKQSKIWFEVDRIHIDPEDLEELDKSLQQKNGKNTKETHVKNNMFTSPLDKINGTDGLTKVVAIDCEMVGVGDDGVETGSMLARVSIVNHFRRVLYDKFVKPTEPVVNYRTFVSGVRPCDLENAEDFKTVQKEVGAILKSRVLVGHAIQNDLKVLFLGHPRRHIRDTSNYKPFKAMFQNRTPSLKRLTEKVLGVKIQSGEHNSVQDAQAAMRLYTMHRIDWENSVRKTNRTSGPAPSRPEKKEKKESTFDSIASF